MAKELKNNTISPLTLKIIQIEKPYSITYIFFSYFFQLFSNSHNSRGRNALVKCLRVKVKGIRCSCGTAPLEPERFMIHCTLVKSSAIKYKKNFQLWGPQIIIKKTYLKSDSISS